MKKIYSTGFLALCIWAASCSYLEDRKKVKYIDDFSAFIRDVEQNNAQWSPEDWYTADSVFENFAQTQYREFADQLTPQERTIVQQLKGAYAGLKAQYHKDRAKEKIRDFLDQGVGFLKKALN